MREKVEHTRTRAILRARYAQAHKHIAQLADRGEGQHALEVILHKGNACSIDGGYSANPGYHPKGRGIGRGEEREGTRYHIHTSSDHSCRVDKCTDRRWTFHGRWQPDMQRHLRRLTYRTAENQDHRQGQQPFIHVWNSSR